MRHILVTGARAKTGAPLTDLLAQDREVSVRAGTRDVGLVRAAHDRVSPVHFDWDDRATWQAAIEGVAGVFVVRPDRPDAAELAADLVAMAPGDARVVLLSELDRGYFEPEDWAPRVERAVRQAGRPWTVLRPGWFMQVFTDPRFMLDDLVRDGRLPLVSGGRAVSWIDSRDIAAVAARALLDPGHGGQVYELTGPEALTPARTASVLGSAMGRPVRHVELSMAEALEGVDGFMRDNDERAYDRIRRGMFGVVTDTVEQVTGRPARTLRQFATEVFAPAARRAAADDRAS
jgi:uncharacterized protein YbjT (DUF2867 family)